MKILKIALKNKNYKIKQLYNGRLIQTGGRNNTGKITLRARGGGVKQLYRLINFNHILWGLSAIVLTVEYSTKRTSFINLICYSNGMLSYILATENVSIGDIINIGINFFDNTILFNKGDVVLLKNTIDGLFIHSLEVTPFKGAKISRSAGTTTQIIKTNYNHLMSLVKLPSGVERLVLKQCIAVVGQVSNSKHFLKKLHKAGQKRNLGIKSHVRGVAMNPVDHPHGGGEGKTSGAGGRRSQVTYKGLPAKGKPTRLKNKKMSYIISYKKN